LSNPYVGEIRMFAGNFAPSGWLFCDGSLLPISEYETLFTLIGTTYGGDGQATFALPDLRGRVPVHAGSGPGLPTVVIGEEAGVEAVTLAAQQVPVHTHVARGSSASGTSGDPTGRVWAASNNTIAFATGVTPSAALDPASVQPAGGSQPHDNMAPFLAVGFIISMFGIYPSPT
jgi:microcystin-dependent protein